MSPAIEVLVVNFQGGNKFEGLQTSSFSGNLEEFKARCQLFPW
jgi:hypothetical protein